MSERSFEPDSSVDRLTAGVVGGELSGEEVTRERIVQKIAGA